MWHVNETFVYSSYLDIRTGCGSLQQGRRCGQDTRGIQFIVGRGNDQNTTKGRTRRGNGNGRGLTGRNIEGRAATAKHGRGGADLDGRILHRHGRHHHGRAWR